MLLGYEASAAHI